LNAAHGELVNFSRDIQEKMWRFYLVNGQDDKVAGAISAMPSLHVASSCGFYLLARARNRWLGRLFFVFLVLMLLGSIHLGWHYAIDGYAGLAGAVVIWWLCGRLVRWPLLQRFLWGDRQGGVAR
jgi:membrane-associated phospholipid phosphatase